MDFVKMKEQLESKYASDGKLSIIGITRKKIESIFLKNGLPKYRFKIFEEKSEVKEKVEWLMTHPDLGIGITKR